MAQAGDARRRARVPVLLFGHPAVPGETGLQGPNLAEIVERPVATQEDLGYSPAMRALAAHKPVWTEQLLDRFIAVPADIAPQTYMEFRAVDDAVDRADPLTYVSAAGRP